MSSKFSDKWDVKKEMKSMSALSRLFKETKLDGSFQRYGGFHKGSGWTKAQGQLYVENFVCGGTFNNVILVDIEYALKYVQDDAKDQESIDYFKKALDEGHKYISIDGNNTSSFISTFVDGKEDFKIRAFGDDVPKSIEEFTEEEQEELRYTDKIEVIFLRKITIEEMCTLFRNLNTSTKLNDQEHRQARWSPLSKFVRDTSNGDNKVLFKNLIINNEDHFDKRAHEQMVAQLASKFDGNYVSRDVKKTGLDYFYENTLNLRGKQKQSIESILNESLEIAKAVGNQKQKLTKGELHTLWDVIQIVTQEYHCEIKNYEKFYEWFLRNDARWDTKSRAIIAAEEEEKSYSYWVKFYAGKQNWLRIRLIWESLIIEDMDYNIQSGMLACKRDSSDNFNFEDKLELLKLQRNNTRNGEEISYIDLYSNPSKWEADHMVSVKDGGETTIENGELMSRFDNRSKGSKSNKPYFPHQKQKVSNEQPSI